MTTTRTVAAGLLLTSLALAGCGRTAGEPALAPTASETTAAPSTSVTDLEATVSAAETELNGLDRDFQLDQDFQDDGTP